MNKKTIVGLALGGLLFSVTAGAQAVSEYAIPFPVAPSQNTQEPNTNFAVGVQTSGVQSPWSKGKKSLNSITQASSAKKTETEK